MAIITLTTDWRNSDYYIGAVKGKILSKDDSVIIVDISHRISLYNVMQASFVLRNCYNEYPEGTIHIIGVNSVLTIKTALLIIECDKQYFLCSDTGFPGLLFPEKDKTVYRFKINEKDLNNFVSLNVFVDVAFKLIKGEKPSALAEKCEDYLHQVPLLPTIDNLLINGSIVYIDSYKNVITNINRDTFNSIGKGNSFEIFVQSNHYLIRKISKSYTDESAGELVAIFNSTDYLEIAVVNGPVADLLNLSLNSTIRIKFSTSKTENKLFLSGE